VQVMVHEAGGRLAGPWHMTISYHPAIDPSIFSRSKHIGRGNEQTKMLKCDKLSSSSRKKILIRVTANVVKKDCNLIRIKPYLLDLIVMQALL